MCPSNWGIVSGSESEAPSTWGILIVRPDRVFFTGVCFPALRRVGLDEAGLAGLGIDSAREAWRRRVVGVVTSEEYSQPKSTFSISKSTSPSLSSVPYCLRKFLFRVQVYSIWASYVS